MVVLDAFYQSHTSENIWIPDQKLVDEFLPPFQHSQMEVDLENPKAFGGLVPPEHYNKFSYTHWGDIQKVEKLSESVADTFAEKFGRHYGNVEAVNIGPQTKLVLVTISSISSTAKGVIRQYPEVGLLKIRLFRPFPKASILKVFEELPDDAIIACVERNFLGDREGAILQEMKRALFPKAFKLYDFYAGVGGKDVPPITIEKIIYKALHNPDEVNWVDVD
jgi:pyruvate/2-oxoacid:ferredoxin oxidoreductase alpha subunit